MRCTGVFVLPEIKKHAEKQKKVDSLSKVVYDHKGFTFLPLTRGMSGKLVNFMIQLDRLKKRADKNNGIFRTSELRAMGATPYDIRKLLSNNTIFRIKPGYYCLYGDEETVSEAAQIARLFPDGVLCMYTALFYFGYSDRSPLQWDIAVEKNTSKSRFKLDYPPVQPYYLKKDLLSFGVTRAIFEDCTMQIFDRDRLICECVFYENKIDRETYNKAIQSYITDAKKSIPHLQDYAKKRHILKKVKDRIGVWL